ncbi:MAG TPA: hypothetical protein VFI08_12685 [Spirochaetia bacterium]|nr:hypothetical protein [Spirochaetia bacterium]
MRRAAFLLVLTCAGALPLVAQSATETDADVPLSTLVLFTSGVGYFQHDGTVDGNAKMELTFSTDQINDLLKSLVLRDLDGGTISSVTYSSRDPITRTLKSFSIDLTSNPTLAGLLAQTRGEQVAVTLGTSTQNGTIIGVESRQVAGSKGDITADFLTLNTATGVTSLPLSDVQGIRFLRKEVQDDLASALQVLSSSHGVEKKKVVLHFSGTGKRRVRIGYLLETPVWKTTYRLVLGDASSHLLQGWALVENTSDNDWRNVGLTLVSGRPITFVMDLYQPLYVTRPQVQLELYQSLMPKTNQMAMEEAPSTELAAADEAEAPPAPAAAPAPRAAAPLASRAAAGAAAPAQPFSVSQGVAAAATGGQVGELFQYVIDKAVTLSRQQSAMLPILNQQVSGDRFSLFNESTDPTHPLNAVKLKNSSSLHLMQGPITVFDGGTYAGDAQITDLAPGAEQLVTYALDLDTEVQAAAGPAPSSLVSVRISRGVFFSTIKAQMERDYTIKNNGTKNRTVLIEHPYLSDWTLTAPKDALERTRDAYRFAVPVAAGKNATLAVIQTQTVEQSVALSSLGNDQVSLYLKNPVVTPAVKAALQKLAGLQAALSATVSQRAGKEARVAEIGNDQARIRENMGRLSQSSDLYKRYVKTLSDEEDELAKLRDDIATLRAQEAAQGKAITDYIQGLEVS